MIMVATAATWYARMSGTVRPPSVLALTVIFYSGLLLGPYEITEIFGE